MMQAKSFLQCVKYFKTLRPCRFFSLIPCLQSFWGTICSRCLLIWIWLADWFFSWADSYSCTEAILFLLYLIHKVNEKSLKTDCVLSCLSPTGVVPECLEQNKEIHHRILANNTERKMQGPVAQPPILVVWKGSKFARKDPRYWCPTDLGSSPWHPYLFTRCATFGQSLSLSE